MAQRGATVSYFKLLLMQIGCSSLRELREDDRQIDPGRRGNLWICCGVVIITFLMNQPFDFTVDLETVTKYLFLYSNPIKRLTDNK